MKTQDIERRIDFEVPNTIGIKAELWDKQPVSFFVSEIPLYSTVLAFIPLGWLVLIGPMTVITTTIWLALIAVITFGGYKLRGFLKKKHVERQLAYRREYVPKLAELLASHGYTLTSKDYSALITSRKSKFKVLNEEGIQYRTYGIDTYEGNIHMYFLLDNEEVRKALIKYDAENRVENIVISYEAEHGSFASTELRDAFRAGVSQALL